jgi:hypothetical protein
VEVQVVGGRLDEDLLDLLFTNKVKSGGGPIQHLELFPESQKAVITFENQEGVLYMIQRLFWSTKPLSFCRCSGRSCKRKGGIHG